MNSERDPKAIPKNVLELTRQPVNYEQHRSTIDTSIKLVFIGILEFLERKNYTGLFDFLFNKVFVQQEVTSFTILDEFYKILCEDDEQEMFPGFRRLVTNYELNEVDSYQALYSMLMYLRSISKFVETLDSLPISLENKQVIIRSVIDIAKTGINFPVPEK